MAFRVPDIPQGVTRNIPRALLGWFNEIKRLLQIALDAIASGGAPANQTYVTSDDATVFLANSRRLIDTATVVWDFGTPNQAKANATGGLVDADYGDVVVSASGTLMTIDANAVSNPKLAQMPAHTFKGNNTGGVADPDDLTIAELTAELDVFVGSGVGSLKGLVPDPGGVAGTTRFLREDGTWNVPPGGGGGGSNPGPMVWLSTLPLAGLTNADFVLTSAISQGYKHFRWYLDNVEPTTDLQNLLVNLSTNGGVSYDNAAGNNLWANHAISTLGGNAAQGNASTTDIILNDNGNTIGNVANEGFTGDLDLMNAPATGRQPRMMWRGMYRRGSDGLFIGVANGGGIRLANQDTDALRFRWSGGGTFAAGTITLYGINETTGPGSTPGVIVKGQGVVDFGAFPGGQEASLVITGQTGILATSFINASILIADSADHSADEHWIEPIEIRVGNIVPGTGFTIYARNVNPLMEPPQQNKGSFSTGVAAGLNTPQGLQIPLAGGALTRLYGLFNVQWGWSN